MVEIELKLILNVIKLAIQICARFKDYCVTRIYVYVCMYAIFFYDYINNNWKYFIFKYTYVYVYIYKVFLSFIFTYACIYISTNFFTIYTI